MALVLYLLVVCLGSGYGAYRLLLIASRITDDHPAYPPLTIMGGVALFISCCAGILMLIAGGFTAASL